jgi:hypothetical protein
LAAAFPFTLPFAGFCSWAWSLVRTAPSCNPPPSRCVTSLLPHLWVAGQALSACCCSSVPSAPWTTRCFFINSPAIHTFKVGCTELVLGLGESLILTCVGPTTAVLVGIVYLAGGVVVVAPMPFGLQGENLSARSGETDDGGVLVVPSLVASSCLTSSLLLRRSLDVRRPVTCVCSWRARCQ